MRIVLPDLRTLPSSTCATPSALAMSAIVACFPLKKNEDVRPGTRRSGICVSRLMSSSDRPSEKYSLLLSPLMFTNGNTATECAGATRSAALLSGASVGVVTFIAVTAAGNCAVSLRCDRYHTTSSPTSPAAAIDTSRTRRMRAERRGAPWTGAPGLTVSAASTPEPAPDGAATVNGDGAGAADWSGSGSASSPAMNR